MKTYAAFYNNQVRTNSSSGGIFSLLAKDFDVVYGVAMTEDCYSAEMVRAEHRIDSLRGSKYLQAKMGDSYSHAKKDLIEGKKVLFSGTGCQINGLKCFLESEFENLTCVDVICHGVPSPALWKRYVEYQESKYGKLKTVDFRCKDKGWKNFGMKENHIYISKDDDPYMQMFLRNYSLRPSCYNCHAKQLKLSDITIADFWGIENVAPNMDDGNGISLVIVRTIKGQELFDNICSHMNWKEVKYEDGVKNNTCEYRSVDRPKQRDTFFSDMKSMSFELLAHKYVEPSFKQKAKRKIKKIIGEAVRKLASDQ